MNLYERDLRRQPVAYREHLPSVGRLGVIGAWALGILGILGAALFAGQSVMEGRYLSELQEDQKEAAEQTKVVVLAEERLQRDVRLAHEIQAWLLGRFDLEVLYHEIAAQIGPKIRVNQLMFERVPEESLLRLRCEVDGDGADYTPFFRALTNYLTNAKGLVIADIQMAINEGSGTLSLDLQIPRDLKNAMTLDARTADTTKDHE